MARRSRRSRKQAESRGFVWMLVGLGLGLLVAVGVYLSDLRVDSSAKKPASAGVTTLPSSTAPAPRPAPTPAPAAAPAEAAEAAAANVAPEERRFDFYDILPQYEVVVPEVEVVTRRSLSTPTAPVVAAAGSYILQTGSFRSHNDADRMQASLALLGIESRIQKVTIDDDVFHRVRVGPIGDLEELDRVRVQLRGAGVEPLMMKVSE